MVWEIVLLWEEMTVRVCSGGRGGGLVVAVGVKGRWGVGGNDDGRG